MVTFYVIFSMVVIFISSFFRYWFRISSIGMSRRSTQKYFNGNSSLSIADAIEKATTDKNFGKLWGVLKNNCDFLQDGKVITFVHPRTLFDNDTVSGDDTYRKIMMSVPGIFVGLGILGTFIGIKDGLGSIVLENSSTINTSIETLINGMNTAFSTSIIGISASIVYMLLFYTCRKLFVVRSVRKFYSFLDSTFEYHSTSKFLSDIREQSVAQTLAVKKLKEDLVAPLEEALEGVFNRTIGPALEQMNSTVTNLSEFSTGSSTAALEGIVDTFLEKLTATSNLQLDNINDQLKVTSESLLAAKDGMDIITEKQLYTSNLHNESSRIIQGTVLNLEDVTLKLQQFKAIAESISGLSSQLTSSTSEHDKVILAFSDRGEKIAEQLENVYSQTSKLWSNHNNSFVKLSDAVEVGVPRFAEEVNRSLGSVLSKFDAELTRAVRSLEGLLEDMQNSFDGLTDKMEEKKVEPTMAKSVNQFAAQVSALSTELKNYRRNQGQING